MPELPQGVKSCYFNDSCFLFVLSGLKKLGSHQPVLFFIPQYTTDNVFYNYKRAKLLKETYYAEALVYILRDLIYKLYNSRLGNHFCSKNTLLDCSIFQSGSIILH